MGPVVVDVLKILRIRGGDKITVFIEIEDQPLIEGQPLVKTILVKIHYSATVNILLTFSKC